MKNIKVLWFYPLIIIISLLVFVAGCKKKVIDLPTVITNQVTVTSLTTATAGGTVTDDGGTEMTARGIVWSNESNDPDLADLRTFDGAQSGTFISKIDNLLPGKTYRVRAYATNLKGTTYGQTVTFTTGP